MCFPVNPSRLLKIPLHNKLPSEVIYRKTDFLVVLKHSIKIKNSMCYSTEGWSEKSSDLLGLMKCVEVTSTVKNIKLHSLKVSLSLLLENIIHYNK